MEVKWTNEQNDAIEKVGSNILVAAAAGSGKTAVLVERIIRKIIVDNVDIDKILVVTFTNAAASEMKERILDAIYKQIDKNPDNSNLQRQINLLNKSNICTIDSFCIDVIKNNFFEINVSANARVANETEIKILKQETIEEIFEEKYMNDDQDFINLIDTYTKYNKDEDLQNLILTIYNYSQSNPFPEKWLNDSIEMFKLSKENDNFSDTIWGKIIIDNVKNIIDNCILKQENIIKQTSKCIDLEKFTNVLNIDLEKYKQVKVNLDNWDKTFELISNFEYIDWPRIKKIENNLIKEEAKSKRDEIKKEFNKIIDNISCDTNQAIIDIDYMYKILLKLQKIILEFSEKFENKKLEKNIIDFNDMEHLALKILIKIDENGNISKTEVAKKYTEKFKEIAIDEYQDINMVQEYILNSVAKQNNTFMVGDVKQSIYQFRQARPQLFLSKYNKYKIEPNDGEDRKIQLFKNFRSRENILKFTNIIFKNIMSKKLGSINYDESEYLNLGASYENIENQNLKTEINIINLKDEVNEWKDETISQEESEENDDVEIVENVILEARLVANKIKKLIDDKYKVFDKKHGTRDIQFRDIAVILRSPRSIAPIYAKEISECGINVYSDSSDNYLESIEIDTIMSLLKIINNPMQDIPLVTVLRSPIYNFTDNELLEISFEKSDNCKISFYEKLINTKDKSENSTLKIKINNFLMDIEKFRQKEKYKPLDELIWSIYLDTGYMNYVTLLPNGAIKKANLKLLFEKAKQYETSSFKGLYNFINFIDKIKLNSGDIDAAKIIGENENVVRIMSIHKSKGLEFPVVILAGTGKNFNFQDLNNKILLHQDLGIGPQYVDSYRHIEFATIPKAAISMKLRNEIISEEMRSLYVALTRAKEKLIITGIQRDANKKLQEKQEILEIYNKEEKLNPFLVQKYITYLDWIELVYTNEKKINDIVDFNIIPKETLYKKENNNLEEKENMKEKLDNICNKLKNEKYEKTISNIFNWKYRYEKLKGIPTKTSVTKIKQMKDTYNINKEKTNNKVDIKQITEKPKFLNQNETERLSAAEKGTLMHLCIQKMDEKKEYDLNKIQIMIDELVKKETITKMQANNINVEKLYQYTQSTLWQDLNKAKQVYKEQPFYMNISANKICDVPKEIDENILVQGVIDLYYINKDNKLVLVDYKTDYIKPGNEIELLDKYNSQLEIYKEAIEQALSKKVDKVAIFSVETGKLISKELKK